MKTKSIVVTYNEKQFTLEFDRQTASLAEKAGFQLDLLAEQPVTQVPILFRYAFAKHHKYLPVSVIEEIQTELQNMPDFLGKLVELYNEPVSSLIGFDEESDKSKKASWEASF